MEQETLFTSSKWDILKCLANGKKSPFELAKLSKTSVANISQQLRLLELAGLVKSERIPNRDKGQPRILYSLVGNNSFVIVSSDNFVGKKFLKLNDCQKAILRIWFLEDAKLHYFVEKAFWSIEKYLDKIESLLIDLNDLKDISLIVVSDNASLKNNLKEFDVESDFGTKTVKFKIVSDSELKKMPKNLYPIYDPKNKFGMED